MCCTWTSLHHWGLRCTWTYVGDRSLCCSWACLHYRDLCCTCKCLHYRGLYCTHSGLSCTWTCLHSGPQPHLNVSTLKRPVRLLNVSKPQRTELHPDVSTVHYWTACAPVCLHFMVLCCTWSYLHYRSHALLLGVCTQKGPVLQRDVSTPQGPEISIE